MVVDVCGLWWFVLLYCLMLTLAWFACYKLVAGLLLVMLCVSLCWF